MDRVTRLASTRYFPEPSLDEPAYDTGCVHCGSEVDVDYDGDGYCVYCANPWCPHVECSDCGGALDPDIAFPDGPRIRCARCWEALALPGEN